MNILIMFILLLSTSLTASAYSIWPSSRTKSYTLNSFDKTFIKNFSELSLSGRADSDGYLWPGSYWPDFEGGIAKRWNSLEEQGFSYHLHSLKELKQMSMTSIYNLSPAEKYDIYRGKLNYPTVKTVWSQTGPNEARWNGICHGVAVASLYHKEPNIIEVISVHGIKIRFYTSDIKALLSLFYAKYARGRVKYIGRRCNRESGSSRNCNDMNAADFHILLTNQLGLRGKSFIADIDRYKEVWNQAASSYSTEIIDRLDDHIHVKTTVHYAGNADPYRTAVIGTDMAFYEERNYEYILIVDSEENILKGQWLSSERPDFAWLKKDSPFTGKWRSLEDLLNSPQSL